MKRAPMSQRSAVCRVAVAVLVLAVARPAPGMVVTGRGLAEVYVDVHDSPSLKPGDRLRVGEPGSTVGELVVVRLRQGVAVCRVASVRRPIVIGDKVTAVEAAPAVAAFAALRSSAPEPAPTPTPAPSPTPTPVPSPTPAPTPTPEPTRTPAPTLKPTLPPPAAKSTASASAPPSSPPLKPTATPGPTIAPASFVPPALPAAAVAADTRFRVKYRSMGNVYLEGGRAQGLNVGDGLRVMVGQSTLAELEVVYAAEHSASCRVLSETRPVRAGDQALKVTSRAAPPAAAVAGVAEAPAAPAPSALANPPTGGTSTTPEGAWGRLRGGASFGYYRSWDETESGLDFQQRTGRVDLGIQDIGGQPLSFTLRARSRQDIRARSLSLRTPQSERSDRLYEVALRYEPPADNLQFEVGRIGIYNFVGVGYLDGGIVRLRVRPSLQLGAFGGKGANNEGFGFASEGQKYGAFVRLAPAGRYATTGYDMALAFVHESAEGDVSREYVSLESRFGSGSRWSLFQRAELDVNRGWRQELSGSSLQLSNLSLSGNLRVGRSANAFVSYDGRRNYRYYQNRLVPEEVFDNLLHQGLRAGLNAYRPGGFGATAGVGMSLKEDDPRHPELNLANAYSASLGVRHANLLGSGFSVGLDASGFSNGYTDGGLVSARLGRRFGAGHMVDLSYGRSLYRIKLDEQERVTQWLRFVGRIELTRHFFVVSDLEYDTGDDLQGPRVFLELGSVF